MVYSTVGQNVPLFQEKGEVCFGGGYSEVYEGDFIWGTSAAGFNAQFAAATGKSTAIIASMYNVKESGEEWSGKGNYLEVGLGKFKPSTAKKFTGDIYGGVGFGSMENSTGTESLDLKFVKYFIQPSGGYAGKHFEFAFTPRVALVSYTRKNEKLESEHAEAFREFWDDHKNTLVFEPGVTLRWGFGNVKLQGQVNFTTFNVYYDEYQAVFTTYSSIGVHFLLSDRWKLGMKN
jgi:hypothetical protein